MCKAVKVTPVRGTVLGVLWGVLALLFPLVSLGAGSVNLAWDASTNGAVSGYNVYYGTASRSYNTQVSSGTNLAATVSGLSGGKTYYFAVTAVDAIGNESDYSNEILYSTSNNPPTISSIANQATIVNTATPAISFTVDDVDTGAAGLTLSGVSSATSIVPNANIVFGGSGQNRTVTLTPAAGVTGTAQITISVSDGITNTSTTFTLTVAPQGSTNTPPTISAIANQSVSAGQSAGPISFTVGDAQTAASSLTVSGASANTTLVPNANIVFGGSGANRTVTVTPAAGQSGTAQITVSVSDGSLSTSTAFTLTVQPANTPPTISAIANQSVLVGQSVGPISFTVGDAQTAASSLTVSGTSANTTLVPNANIVFGGSAANCTVTVTPAAGQSGSAQITVSVSDGSLTTSTSFTVTVAQQVTTNTPPTISAISDQNVYVSQSAGPISFTIGDAQTAASSLTLSATSANTALVPNVNIVFGGSGANRTVTVTPTANQSGSAQIQITVSDGSLTATSSFVLNVVSTTVMPTSAVSKSTYSGLFYESDAIRVRSAGSFKLTVSTGGKYSGSLQMASGLYAFSGQFGAVCQATNVTATRKGASSLTLNFSLQPGRSTNQFLGSVSDGTWAAQMHGAAAGFNAKTNPAPYMGTYTLAIPGQVSPPFSLGNGFGSLKVDGNGNVKFSGVLADGTKVTQSSPLSADGTWAMFVPLYSGNGLAIAWISFTNRTTDDLHGALSWIKQPSTTSLYYPGGLTLDGNVIGSKFVPGSSLALTVEASKLQAGHGANGKITTLKISLGTGTIKGSIEDQTSGVQAAFQGALLQKANAAYGFVFNTNQSVPLILTP